MFWAIVIMIAVEVGGILVNKRVEKRLYATGQYEPGKSSKATLAMALYFFMFGIILRIWCTTWLEYGYDPDLYDYGELTQVGKLVIPMLYFSPLCALEGIVGMVYHFHDKLSEISHNLPRDTQAP